MTDTVKINGITYEVIERVTPEVADQQGHHNVARMLRDDNSNQLHMKRPNGHKCYFVKEGNHPKYGKFYGKVFSF